MEPKPSITKNICIWGIFILAVLLVSWITYLATSPSIEKEKQLANAKAASEQYADIVCDEKPAHISYTWTLPMPQIKEYRNRSIFSCKDVKTGIEYWFYPETSNDGPIFTRK